MSGNETRITKISRVAERSAEPSPCCLIQIVGPQLGKRFVLDQDEMTIGRDLKNHIVVEVDSVSRKHARVLIRGAQVFLEDLESLNGTLLNGEEIHGERVLNSGDLLKIGGAVFKFLSGNSDNALESQYHEEIYQLTIVDGLTQVNNKRYVLEYLEREIGRCHRYNRSLSLLLFDLDRFKAINDTNGHLAGDYVLRELAQLVKPRVRKEECLARYGGEEFALVLPESGPEKARLFAEKIRRLVEEHRFVFEEVVIPVTISIGVADLTAEMMEPSQFLKVADQALYTAKSNGRNRVEG